MTTKLLYTATADDIVSSMNALRTISAALGTVSTTSSSQICNQNAVTTTIISIKAPAGNMPRPSLLSSIRTNASGLISSVSSSATEVLTWAFFDGRDSEVKVCNGIGTCHYDTMNCTCPFGWGYDPDFGPCGLVLVNTSDFLGLGRCPGIVYTNDPTRVIDDHPNYHERSYFTFNPDAAGVMTADWTSGSTVLSVTSLISGVLSIGDFIYGTGIKSGTTITAQVSTAIFVGFVGPETSHGLYVMTVTSVTSGMLGIGQVLSGSNIITAGTRITALGTGTGGTGTYIISAAATSSSATMTGSGGIGTYTMSVAQPSTKTDVLINANVFIAAQLTANYELSETQNPGASNLITASSSSLKASIVHYTWYPKDNPVVELSTRTLFVTLSTAVSASYVLLDQGKGYIYYIDKGAVPYIGKKRLTALSTVSSSWLILSQSLPYAYSEIYGFVMDAYMVSNFF